MKSRGSEEVRNKCQQKVFSNFYNRYLFLFYARGARENMVDCCVFDLLILRISHENPQIEKLKCVLPVAS